MLYHATAAEMERLDELAVRQGFTIRQMMELAGWQMMSLFGRLKIGREKSVTIVCGKGNKAGDGLCAARHLVNHGFKVQVVLVSTGLKPEPKYQLRLLKGTETKILLFDEDEAEVNRVLRRSDILIDALVGYHLRGAPRDKIGQAVQLMNKTKKRIITYDLPTGLDASTGEAFDPCIGAWATLTLALPKKGFRSPDGKENSGKIFLADIGIPAFVYDRIAQKSRPDFAKSKDFLIELK